MRRKYHPGSYLNDYLDAENITISDFSNKSNISINDINLLIKEEIPITDEIATKLAMTLGTSKECWLNLQKRFDS